MIDTIRREEACDAILDFVRRHLANAADAGGDSEAGRQPAGLLDQPPMPASLGSKILNVPVVTPRGSSFEIRQRADLKSAVYSSASVAALKALNLVWLTS
jgi:hypothetical protein